MDSKRVKCKIQTLKRDIFFLKRSLLNSLLSASVVAVPAYSLNKCINNDSNQRSSFLSNTCLALNTESHN